LLRVSLVDLREYTHDRHRSTDDTPYGGGHGMVMKVGPIVEALEAIATAAPRAHRVLLSPRGRVLDHRRVMALSTLDDLVLVCGRYEGVDERVRDFVDEELSVGDYVLSGGEPAALVVIDAVVRQIPGALGNQASAGAESFVDDRLEYPQYTRPEVFRDRAVPPVLLSGDHAEITAWRTAAAHDVTARMRPDLLNRAPREQ
jgi:tRNA (guanine37-N1)-methyltransferase